jgi:hypothetical protein
MRLAALALCLLPLAGCAGATPNVRRPDATLTVVCPVGAARVYVDDAYVGRAAELAARPAPVVSGTVRVEVRADGWFTAYRELGVAPGARARLEVPLRHVPDGEPGG